MKFTQQFYFKAVSILMMIITFSSCFSLGYSYVVLDPGQIIAKICWIFMYFLGSLFFMHLARMFKQQEDAFKSFDADKIIEKFEKPKKKKKTVKKR